MAQALLRLYTWVKEHPALVISLVSLLIGIAGFMLTHFGRLKTAARWIGSLLGLTGARYKTRFLAEHGKLRNIYLNRVEILDVESTFVPLRMVDPGESSEAVQAIDVLLSPVRPRILILGDPGTGKTTLLKAFGVSLLSTQRQRDKRAKELASPKFVPIYLELRDFSARRNKYQTIREYIVGHVLEHQFGIPNGESFLKRLLAKESCIFLLDALDEVAQEDYEAVRSAVHDFMASHAALPLSSDSSRLSNEGARVVMTSRLQNFLPVEEDWIPHGFLNYHVLAPFSDEDIIHFLQKRAADLPSGKTVAALWNEIRNSNTLDLHRTPLILTLSLGLYINVPRYAIPESIATFYHEITRELIQRHDFRTRTHLEKKNKYTSDSKVQFLRELALRMAIRPGKFDEFSYTEIGGEFDSFCQRSPRLTTQDKDRFIKEIIDNAGLLKPVGDDTYVFAHRSFHEYFAGDYLAKNANVGLQVANERANDPLWRQVIVFFSALEHDKHDPLLEGLANTNPEIAGYCLSVATSVSPRVALLVINRLDRMVTKQNAVSVLGALSSICRSSGEVIGSRVIGIIGRILSEILVPEHAKALWGLSKDDLLRLVVELANTGARNVIETCINISALVGDDHRFVDPLWNCLSNFVMEPRTIEACRLVPRLLELTQTQDGIDALKIAQPLHPEFMNEDMCNEVYPFMQGRSEFTNLITLLAWADLLDVLPERQNGFLLAFSQRRIDATGWRKLDREIAKNTLSVTARPVGAALFWAGMISASLGLFLMMRKYGWIDFWAREAWVSSGLFAGFSTVVLFGLVVTLLVAVSQSWLPANSSFSLAVAEPQRYLSLGTPPFGSTKREVSGYPGSYPSPSNPIVYLLDRRFKWLNEGGAPFWDWDTPMPIIVCSLLQIPLIVAALEIARGFPVFAQAALGVVFCLFIFWWPATRLFLPGSRLALRRRARLAKLILNDKSSHYWIPNTLGQ